MNKITVAKVVAYIVATIAAVSSYGHQVHLLALADLDPLFGVVPSEWVTPITVDALAIIALMVRTADVSVATKRWAMLPLTLAGGLSIAANVAMARNIVQIIVGVWTVGAYIVAEIFVSKLDTKVKLAAPATGPVHATATISTPAQTVAAVNVPPATAITATPRVAPATRTRQTITSALPLINPATGQAYSVRHARRIRTGR